ncbi:uncharacterized protein LOC132567599 [Heteronotia binoei]|uniref:uncharacterized protein LOC132567599 n=1 Tax=Heteronotia binoei TaxID=13085 RepID=UPI00292ED233|nr:uncharacterized protein LOC132567599 [Heteronotia binoei]
MKQLSSFLLMLVLTGSFVLSKTHSPTTPIIPFFERPNEAGRNQELNILQGESLRIYLFCDQEHLNTAKVWCKEEPLKGCLLRTNPVIFSEPEWKVLTMASNQKVKLGDSRKSCASVHMTTVEVEDSGLFWFGLLHGQKINYLSPIKIVVHKGLSVPSTTDSSPTFRTPSFESSSKIEWKPVKVTVTQGEPLSIVGFCGQQHLKTKKVWCKEELLKECNLKTHGQLLGPG